MNPCVDSSATTPINTSLGSLQLIKHNFPAEKTLPETMSLYGMGGTPTLLLIDRKGYLRKHTMGHEQDLILGAEIMNLINEE